MKDEQAYPRIVQAEQSGIMLDERGRWFHEGEEIENIKIKSLFHRCIRKDDSGRYYLNNEMGSLREIVYFQVQDTAYFIHHIVLDDENEKLLASVNTGVVVKVDADSLTQDERGVMYCSVLDDDRARLTINALHDLSELVSEDAKGIFLEIQGRKIRLS